MIDKINELYNDSPNKVKFIEEVRKFLFTKSKHNKNPVDLIYWIPLEKIHANNYNPNQVAKNEMKLLYTSIKHDGYTQPVVTIYDKDLDKYIIVDGFHRYSIMRLYKDIRIANNGLLPCVVINKEINDMMASTVRHNRARGKHSINGMSNIIFKMLDNGWTDAEILKELGMEIEELIRMKHITGFSKLFENVEYSKAWETKRQMKLKKNYQEINIG